MKGDHTGVERMSDGFAASRADIQFSALQIAEGSSLQSVVNHVESVRGTVLRIAPLDALRGTAACGLVLLRNGVHDIYYVPATSPLHRMQCILHELSHVLLRHDETTTGDDQLARFVPDLCLEVGDKLFGRVAFDDEIEVEAEHLADRLAAAIRTPRPLPFEEHFG
jgi:hypothetical protein